MGRTTRWCSRSASLALVVAVCCLCGSSAFTTNGMSCSTSKWRGIAAMNICRGAGFRPLRSRFSDGISLLGPSLRNKVGRATTTFMVSDEGGESFPSMTSVEYYSEEGNMEDAAEARSLGRVEEIGLFPLGLVLNPGATLPLHIFEMRYRQLFNSAWDGNQKMGIVMYDKEKNKWARVGTSARVVRFQPLPDGRILTVNEGEERFRVLKVTRSGSSKDYIKALVEYIDDDVVEPETLGALESEVWESLQSVLALSNALYGKSLDLKDAIKKLAPDAAPPADTTQQPAAEQPAEEGEGEGSVAGEAKEASLRGTEDGVVRGEDAERRLTDPERQRLFSFAVSQVLDMPLEDQQLMLQSTVTEDRLRKQVALLSQARQYLAAQVALKNAFGKSVE